MKKIIALALCFCMLRVPVSASGGLSLAVSGPEAVTEGDEIELVFTFASIDGKGLCGVDIEIGFNKSLVEFDSVSISGFPEAADWAAAGKVSGSTYLLHVFDDYKGSAPISIYQGTKAFVSVKFRALKGASGFARFSTTSYGAVMGCYFENGETVSFAGTGSEVSVRIRSFVKDCVEERYCFKNGVLYALPGVTAGELVYNASAVADKNGKAKSKSAPLAAGDILDFGDDHVKSTAVILCDLNSDGAVTTNDYLLLKMHIKGEHKLTNSGIAAADVNMDGTVSLADAVCFAKLLRGEGLDLRDAAA